VPFQFPEADVSDNPAHEETISSERGFDGKLIHVRVDRVRMPSGKESVREVVEHPGAVSILALTENDEVILIRQWRHVPGAIMLEMPAGTREPGEDEDATARRELREETGYEAGEIRQVTRFYSSSGFCDEQITLFHVTGCTPVDRDDDPDERTEVVLVPRAEIPRLVEEANREPRDAKFLIGMLWLSQQSS
jgi:ADP-ribose pyrophosphatase